MYFRVLRVSSSFGDAFLLEDPRNCDDSKCDPFVFFCFIKENGFVVIVIEYLQIKKHLIQF